MGRIAAPAMHAAWAVVGAGCSPRATCARNSVTLSSVRMGIIDYKSDKHATVHLDERHIATLYRLDDGWHAKAAHLHTKEAWAGPFADVNEAAAALVS